MALMEEVSHLRMDFEVLKDSGCFYLVLSLPVCGLRCEPPAAAPAAHCHRGL